MLWSKIPTILVLLDLYRLSILKDMSTEIKFMRQLCLLNQILRPPFRQVTLSSSVVWYKQEIYFTCSVKGIYSYFLRSSVGKDKRRKELKHSLMSKT